MRCQSFWGRSAKDEPEVDEDVLLCGRVAGRPPAGENLAQAVGGGGELEPEHSGPVLAHLSKRRKLGSAENEQEAGLEPAMPADDLALILRALGIGLAIESLVSPEAVRHNLYGDFVELLVSLLRERGQAKQSRGRTGAKR
jgi:hypothetical protein